MTSPAKPTISDPPRHLVVRASAGTGKTYRLATRYLTLLRRGAAPSSILATTFTRKAAGEILGRVLVRLARAAMDSQDTHVLASDLGDPSLTIETCRSMLAELCANLHCVAISTLDSFFGRIAQSFRYELALPPASAMAGPNDPRLVQIRLDAIEAVLAAQEPAILIDLLRRLHHDTARSSVTRAIDEIVRDLYDQYRAAPDEASWSRIAAPAGPDRSALENAIGQLATLQGQFANKPLTKSLAKSLRAVEAGDWKTLLCDGLGNRIVSGETLYHGKPLDGRILEAYGPLLRHAQVLLIGQYAQMNQATFQLMQRFDEHFTRLREAQGLLLFSDLPHRLGRRMGQGDDPDGLPLEELYFRLDAKVGHLLLDEFQDTSPEQWHVLMPLAQEICAHGDGSRTLFCVGDAKQAIYGWRGGSAELFDHLAQDLNLPAASQESTSLSYRSAQVILDAVNQVFSDSDAPAEILKECADEVAAWHAGFEAHHAAKPWLPGYVELVTSVASGTDATGDGGEKGDDEVDDDGNPRVPLASATPHEDFAADLIARLERESPGRSIGVLVSRNGTVRLMIDLLRRRGVRASGEGGVPVTDDAAVNVVLAAMTMADHPGDTVSAFHVFHSPLAPVLGLESLDPPEVQRVALAVRLALAQWGYARLIARWARELAPACDARGALRLAQLVELADLYDPAITLRPRQFVEFVAATPIEEPSPAPVRVMTIHKAKGLEFDMVVLPELDRAILGLGQLKVYLERPAPARPVEGVYRATFKELRALLPEVEQAYQQELARRLRDDLSSLYVAMTRARHALHMVIRPLQGNKDGSAHSRGLTSKSFASILRRALASEDQEDFSGNQTLYRRGDATWQRR